jgi:cytochrome c oxidase assembly factor CtaG
VLAIAVAALATALFALAMVRLRGRGRPDHAGLERVLLWALGLAVLLTGLLAFDARADENLAWHMTQHVLIGDLAPALLVLATRGPLALFLLPPSFLRPLARTPLRRILQPRLVFGLWAATLAIWHIPALYDYAESHENVHYLEHVCWTIAGLLAWTILLDERRTVGRRVALAAAMFASGTILADVLIFSFTAIYPAYPSVRQQQLAGVVMMIEQVLTLGTLVFVLLRPRLRRAFRPVPA